MKRKAERTLKNNYRLVIFDLDGTIVNAYPAIYESVNFTLKQFACAKQSKPKIRRAVGWGDKELLRAFMRNAVLEKALLTYRRHHAAALVKYSRLIPGALKTLKRLKDKGFSLAVASNRPEKFSRILLRTLKIEEYFDYVLCGDMVSRSKPHPMILKKIMTELGVRSAEAVYAGDMAIDIQAGKSAKVTTVGICGGSSSKAELLKEKPDFLISNVGKLAGILE